MTEEKELDQQHPVVSRVVQASLQRSPRLDSAAKFWSDQHLIRALVGQVPVIGAWLDNALTSQASQLVEERFRHFLEELDSRCASLELTSPTREFLESDEFADLSLAATQRAVRSRTRAKIARFAALVVGRVRTLEGCPEDLDDALDLIDDLSDTEYTVCEILMGIEGRQAVLRAQEATPSTAFGGENVVRSTDIQLELGWDEAPTRSALARAAAKGAIRELVGNFWGYTGGAFLPLASLRIAFRLIRAEADAARQNGATTQGPGTPNMGA